MFKQSVQRLINEAQKPVGQGGNTRGHRFLRASGMASTSGPVPINPVAKPQEGKTYTFAMGPAEAVIATLKVGMQIWLTWTAAYARRIEYGFTGQIHWAAYSISAAPASSVLLRRDGSPSLRKSSETLEVRHRERELTCDASAKQTERMRIAQTLTIAVLCGVVNQCWEYDIMAGVSGVNGVFVVVDDGGNVYWVDGTQGGPNKAATLTGRGPFSVACSLGGGRESCIVSDAAGNCWRGPARATGENFNKVS